MFTSTVPAMQAVKANRRRRQAVKHRNKLAQQTAVLLTKALMCYSRKAGFKRVFFLLIAYILNSEVICLISPQEQSEKGQINLPFKSSEFL